MGQVNTQKKRQHERQFAVSGVDFSAVRVMLPRPHWRLRVNESGDLFEAGAGGISTESVPKMIADVEELLRRVSKGDVKDFRRRFGLSEEPVGKDQERPAWVLVDEKTGCIIKLGDTVRTFRGEIATLKGFSPPRSESSTGRVSIRVPGMTADAEYYPSVIGAAIRSAGTETAEDPDRRLPEPPTNAIPAWAAEAFNTFRESCDRQRCKKLGVSNWKEALRLLWYRAIDDREPNGGVLRSIRNHPDGLGTLWLDEFPLKAVHDDRKPLEANCGSTVS